MRKSARKPMLVDRKFRLPRKWSNRELRKFAHLFTGSVVNVSGWKDEDKEGGKYRDYFTNASSYHISNWKSEARGLQGFKNEFFLDLAEDLDKSLNRKFDVVFNHTVLEHIYETRKAFRNLCLMSKDIVIVVVPFLQQMHSDYGDYWRFTPLAVKRLFEENGFGLVYLSFNDHRRASVYIFAIGSRTPKKWKKIGNRFDYTCRHSFLDYFENYAGCRAVSNSLPTRVTVLLRYLKDKLLGK